MGVANPSPPPGILSLSEDQYLVNAYNPPYLPSLYFNDNQLNYPLNSLKRLELMIKNPVLNPVTMVELPM